MSDSHLLLLKVVFISIYSEILFFTKNDNILINKSIEK